MKNELEKSEMTFVNDIKKIIQDGRNAAYSAVSSVMIQTYWNIGKRIVEQEQNGKSRAEYGTHLIDMLAEELKLDYGDGFSARYLRQFRKFYTIFPDSEIWKSRFPNLTWTHYLMVLRVEDTTACRWYIETASKEMWSTRTLDRNISTQYFERQQHIHTDAEDYYIDLVFYNIVLKCYVLIDLKKGKIRHQDVGQMDMYVRMYDELKRTEGDNPTIGLVLCSETDEAIAKYSVLNNNDQLYAAKLMTCMPTQEQLKAEIEQQKEIYRLQHGGE